MNYNESEVEIEGFDPQPPPSQTHSLGDEDTVIVQPGEDPEAPLSEVAYTLARRVSSTLIYGQGDLSILTVKMACLLAGQFLVRYCSAKSTLWDQMQQVITPYPNPFYYHYVIPKIELEKQLGGYLAWNFTSVAILDGLNVTEKISQTSNYKQLLDFTIQMKQVLISTWLVVPKNKLPSNIRTEQWDNIVRVDIPKTGAHHPRRFLVTIEKALFYRELPTAFFTVDGRSYAWAVKPFGGKYKKFEMAVRYLTQQGYEGKKLLEVLPTYYPLLSTYEPRTIPSLVILNNLKRQWNIYTYRKHKKRKAKKNPQKSHKNSEKRRY